jgi:uncharacterized protein YukE
MAATDVPGLAEIQAWAGFLGMDVTETVHRAQMLMQTDPAAVRAGGERLGTVVNGLSTGGDDLRLAGDGVLAAGWGGEAADAFSPNQAGLLADLADIGGAAGEVAAQLGAVARVFAGSQQAVVTATGATATTLRMLRA